VKLQHLQKMYGFALKLKFMGIKIFTQIVHIRLSYNYILIILCLSIMLDVKCKKNKIVKKSKYTVLKFNHLCTADSSQIKR